MTYHRVCNQSNTTGSICGAGTAYTPGAPVFILGFQLDLSYAIYSSMCNVLQIIVCSFVLISCAIVLSVLLRLMQVEITENIQFLNNVIIIKAKVLMKTIRVFNYLLCYDSIVRHNWGFKCKHGIFLCCLFHSSLLPDHHVSG